MEDSLGVHFNKRDIDRCGLFADLGYVNGEKFNDKRICSRTPCYRKFAVQVPPQKCGLQGNASGYFDDKFRSVDINVKYVDGWKTGLVKKEKGINLWKIQPGSKLNSTPGDHYGTFTEQNIEAFSPLKKPRQRQIRNGKLFIVKTGQKKGGPGYADITLSKYPIHMVEREPKSLIEGRLKKDIKMHLSFCPRPYFTENPYKPLKIMPTYKKRERPENVPIFFPAGLGGYFNKYPKYYPERFGGPKVKKVAEIKYQPPGVSKSFYTVSVIQKKLKSACNATNYRILNPITYPL